MDDPQLCQAPKGAGKGKAAGRGLGSERPNGGNPWNGGTVDSSNVLSK